MQVMGFWQLICVKAKQLGNLAMYEKGDSSDNFCAEIDKSTINWARSSLEFSQLQLMYDLTVLLPVVTFLLFDDPHDCFACLGKDPDRIYSSF